MSEKKFTLPDGYMFIVGIERKDGTIRIVENHIVHVRTSPHPICGEMTYSVAERAAALTVSRIEYVCPECMKAGPEELQVMFACALMESGVDDTVVVQGSAAYQANRYGRNGK